MKSCELGVLTFSDMVASYNFLQFWGRKMFLAETCEYMQGLREADWNSKIKVCVYTVRNTVY